MMVSAGKGRREQERAGKGKQGQEKARKGREREKGCKWLEDRVKGKLGGGGSNRLYIHLQESDDFSFFWKLFSTEGQATLLFQPNTNYAE